MKGFLKISCLNDYGGIWKLEVAKCDYKLGGSRYLPFAFTEHGVLIISSVLRSEQAVQVNIQIMRVYSKMKELLMMHKDILVKLEQLERKTDKHDEQIEMIFDYIKKWVEEPAERTER